MAFHLFVLQEEDFEYEEQFEGDEECCEYECVPLKSIFAGERQSINEVDDGDDDDPDEREKGGKLIQ